MNTLLLLVALVASPKASPAKAQETLLVFDVKPAAVTIFLDGKKVGTAAKVHTVKVKPGVHRIQLRLKRDESEAVVTVKKGTKMTFQFDMTDSGAPPEKPPPPKTEDAPAQPEDSPARSGAPRDPELDQELDKLD